MNAFLTGSRAYGTPREDSDIDICVLLDDWIPELEKFYEEDGSGGEDGVSFKLPGGVNIIAFSKKEEHVFRAWHAATQELKERKPVTRRSCGIN